jgi:hypothetical protein
MPLPVSTKKVSYKNGNATKITAYNWNTVLKKRNDTAVKTVLIDYLQSPFMSWKNIIHLKATKIVDISSQSIAAPNTKGMLNGTKLQNMVWKPRRW